MLKRYDYLPDGMFNVTSIELEKLIGGPALFYLEGVRKPPLFITVLQHGNEPTGFEAVQQILRKYQAIELPRAIWLFVANVGASAAGVRTLNSQTDYNRAWPGTANGTTSEAALMQQVVDTVTAGPLFASVDLHNNTGSNPYYGCVNELKPEYLQLATLFARTVVYFRQPVGVQSLAMSEYCPAVTLECGQAGEYAALDQAANFLDACLHMHHLPGYQVSSHDINLLRTVAVAKMREGITFGFGPENHQVQFRPDLDRLNFSQVEAGETFAHLSGDTGMPLTVVNDDGIDISATLFDVNNGRLKLKQPLTPSMATLDVGVIKQDCLFYVMERMTLRDEGLQAGSGSI